MRGLANFVQQAIQTYDLSACDRILQFASLSFDTAIEEIYGALCSGATLVLRSDEMIRTSQAFCRTCEQLNLTVLDLPTAFWHQLTQGLASRPLLDTQHAAVNHNRWRTGLTGCGQPMASAQLWGAID